MLLKIASLAIVVLLLSFLFALLVGKLIEIGKGVHRYRNRNSSNERSEGEIYGLRRIEQPKSIFNLWERL